MKKFTIIGLCLAALFVSCTSKPQTIIGRVQIFGNEPHTYTGIVANGAVYAVYPPEKEAELQKLQGRNIEFKVRFLEEPQGYGSIFLKDGCVTPMSWKIKKE
jgi:hypothetical protein